MTTSVDANLDLAAAAPLGAAATIALAGVVAAEDKAPVFH